VFALTDDDRERQGHESGAAIGRALESLGFGPVRGGPAAIPVTVTDQVWSFGSRPSIWTRDDVATPGGQ